jgi:hypothetical protein
MNLNMTANPQTRDHKSGECARLASLEQRLACLADAGPAAITDRIAQLDREWSAGRMVKVALGIITLVGAGLAVLSPWWLILPAVACLFLLQSLFSRSSWLAAAFQGLGYRPGSEIEQEKFALKTLRGDFKHVPTVHDIETQDDITRLEGEGGIVIEPDDAKVDPKVAVKEAIQATQAN